MIRRGPAGEGGKVGRKLKKEESSCCVGASRAGKGGAGAFAGCRKEREESNKKFGVERWRQQILNVK